MWGVTTKMPVDMRDWSEGWIKDGHFISYWRSNVQFYEFVKQRDLGHWEYNWPETISAGKPSGPHTPDELEITRGYDERTNLNRLWQMIFGIKGQAYIYIELPTDRHRHGIPKAPKPSTTMRRVSHFEEWMSPWREPTFITEHFMMRPDTFRISFDAYNPQSIDLTDVKLNIFLNKMVTERIGTNDMGTLSTPTISGNPTLTRKLESRWRETLTKLYKRQIPHRPITLLPVTAPAEAPSGE